MADGLGCIDKAPVVVKVLGDMADQVDQNDQEALGDHFQRIWGRPGGSPSGVPGEPHLENQGAQVILGTHWVDLEDLGPPSESHHQANQGYL